MSITLEDVENLSIEVKALVHAGLPLQSHLAAAGAGHGQRLQQLTKSISAGLAEGKSLEDTVRDNSTGVPRIVAASIAAGVRTGKLAESIEMLGDMAHDMIELRRRVMQSITYPLTVVAVATMLFFLFIRRFLGTVRYMFDDPDASPSEWFLWFSDLDQRYSWWPLIFPALIALVALVWVLSGRASSLTFRGPERLMFLVPGVRGLVRDLHFYNLSRMLSLLIERETPLTDALQLAGACSGSQHLDQACQTAAQRIQRGDVPAIGRDEDWRPGAMPPMLMTCLRQSSEHEQQLCQRLHSVTGYYRRRLDVSVGWLRNIVPVVMFVVVGGGTVLLYALTVFWPISELYYNLIPS